MDTKKINDIEVKDFIDVTANYECTEEEAQKVLDSALTNEATYQQIWEAISYKAESINLKRRD